MEAERIAGLLAADRYGRAGEYSGSVSVTVTLLLRSTAEPPGVAVGEPLTLSTGAGSNIVKTGCEFVGTVKTVVGAAAAQASFDDRSLWWCR